MTELQMLFVNILKIKSNKYVNIGHSQSNTIKYGGIFNVDFSTGLVTATELNVRSGPGTQYKIVTTVKKNEYIRVFAGVGNWYIVQVEGDYIGAVSQKYVKPIYPSSSNTGTSTGSGQTTTTASMNADEKEVFDLINKQRTNNGLQA